MRKVEGEKKKREIANAYIGISSTVKLTQTKIKAGCVGNKEVTLKI